jgi:glycosyltransferase involved in cell wall biosynthesis
LQHISSSGNPSVSVCVPVYNGELFLRETLDSILVQTFQDYEIVVSDNASTDLPPEICNQYVARDPRIQYSSSRDASPSWIVTPTWSSATHARDSSMRGDLR